MNAKCLLLSLTNGSFYSSNVFRAIVYGLMVWSINILESNVYKYEFDCLFRIWFIKLTTEIDFNSVKILLQIDF